MLPPSPTLLIQAANTYVGWQDDPEDVRIHQRSAFVECLLRQVHADLHGETPVPWHTAFIHHVGYWSHFDTFYGASSWPLPATASADELAAFAEERGVLGEEPAEGDLFVLWSDVRHEYVRTGIIVREGDPGLTARGTPYVECLTIEANIDERRSLSGALILRQWRRLSAEMGDRFIRWPDLDVRAERVAGFLLRGAERADENERAEVEVRGMREAREVRDVHDVRAMTAAPFRPL
jgi:hypothetical protein